MSIKNRLYQIFIGLILLLGIVVGSEITNAASIFDAPNVSIPANGEAVSGKYSFIAKYTKGITKISTFGEGWSTTKNIWRDGTEEAYYSLRPQSNQKGNNGVIYSSVGNYNGKTIDLKITLKDWQQFSKYQGYISYSKENISHFAQGYDYVDQSWEFIDQATGMPVKVSGFMTINDIDGGQGVQFSKETSTAIDKIYVSSADNWINYENINGEYKFFDTTGTSSANEDLFATFTVLFSEQSSFRFKWCVNKSLLGWDYNTLNFEKDHVGDAGYQGAYFGYIAKKPLKTETLSPVKKNSDSNEVLVDKNTLIDREELQTYTIVHQVPDEYEDFYYKSYTFQDTLDSVFDIQRVTITNEAGTDCSALFDMTIASHTVTYTAKAATLKNPDFYNHYYTTVIQAKIRKEAELSFSNGVAALKNTATVTIDGMPKDSNTTVTEIPQLELPPPIKRVVDESGKDMNKKDVLPGEILVYEIDQTVNELNKDVSSKYTEFSISDVLPPQVSFVSAKILKDGKAIDAEKISYDKEKHSVSFVGDSTFLKNMTMKNETYTLQIKTQVVDAVGDKEKIENSGATSINKQTQKTNQVENTTKLITGTITVNKTTKQLTGFKEAKEKEAAAIENELIWQKLPQQGVAYQVKAHKDIVFPNGKVVAKAGYDYGKITTDETGKAIIKNLYEGEYALVEIEAPFGIQLAAAPIIVTLKLGKENELKTEVNLENDLQQVKLVVNKAFEQENGEFKASDGAVFGLYHGKDYELKNQTITADTLAAKIEIKNGIGEYQGPLIVGQQYYIQEISTKDGYQLNTSKFQFIYKPVSNKPVHEIELFENGYTENAQNKSYLTKEAANEELSSDIKMSPIKNRRMTENSIVKSIVKENGQEVEHYDLLKTEEQITFKGVAFIGDNENKNPLQIIDHLPTGFTYKSSKVYDEAGQEITEKSTVSVKGQQVVLTIAPEYAEQLERSTVCWMITTTYSYSDSHQNQVFKNQLQLLVNEQEIPSNIVTLKPPTTTAKPFGKLPETGELLGYSSVIGAALLLFAVAYKYTKKENAKEHDRNETH